VSKNPNGPFEHHPADRSNAGTVEAVIESRASRRWVGGCVGYVHHTENKRFVGGCAGWVDTLDELMS
jgi:hypothetical protein